MTTSGSTTMKHETIRVLIVDDSPTVRLMLEQIFRSDPAFTVAGVASDGLEAISAVDRLAPDVITMDMFMPAMDGLEATRRIMERRPTPIVMVSGNLDPEEVISSFRAMEAGALVAVPKPRGMGHPEHDADAALLIQRVKLMAEVRVVRRWPARPAGGVAPLPLPPAVGPRPEVPRIVAIGASTGGPVAINTILSALPADFPAPVLIVQHMAQGFIHGFAEWLGLSSRLPVHVGGEGERPLPGHVYIAPEGCHMLVEGGILSFSRSAPENGQVPSVSALFRSVAQAFGSGAIGILLTGMGNDGARELRLIRESGGVTIAQDEASSVVFGMPGEAMRFAAATCVLSPDRIAGYLTSKLTGRA
ncbi:MAG TPA: chemotaxis-specific protein-glutamate methyltransferase CheB [Desulfuromonadaceae bacterium]